MGEPPGEISMTNDPHLRGNGLFGANVARQFKRHHVTTFKRLPAVEQARHVDEIIVGVIALYKTVAFKIIPVCYSSLHLFVRFRLKVVLV
jgi:hypothetical protein